MGLTEFLAKYKRIALDTNIFISLFAEEPLGEKVVPIIHAVANKGTHEIIASVLSFSECAVRPYRDGNWAALDQVKLMFQMPNLTVCEMDGAVAEEAARIRAVYNLKMPDAIIVATAIIHKADVFLTNDHRLGSVKEIPIIKLDEL
ncbi:MAG TPA: PIN domain-containing protein [Methylomusa anaerophila]|uniref:tRNA(fMet)-specific endonuclease VapC n=1 Tax=Methylomusa anaerophila TaxID=1930071 RepID=A0A348AKJ1_9FIRM|nr:PIN domain-containing protein [Methylomusa anaerophila]BBB91589.1 tRNA(fMet)-specific endonuclease VapC [Methylomusa anaerophila]HML89473.1 PIN domain-containing protein [Methylomusa anaerophila]